MAGGAVKPAAAVAVLSALTIAVGVGLMCMPAGLVTAGVEGLVGAYMWAYLWARREETGEGTRRTPTRKARRD